jgi:ribonuclease-3
LADPLDLPRHLGYEFSDPALLQLALTHRSHCAETDAAEPNERLEFLGDAVLGLAVTEHIFRVYGELAEGELAKLRASVVNTATLADVARRIGVGSQLLLGRGEDQSGGRDKESILADALEAIFGAVFVDAGWQRSSEVVLDLLTDDIRLGAERPGRQDYKTRLQELAAELSLSPPSYELSSSGPDHDRLFDATVSIAGVDRGAGRGTSKKRAEQAAAAAAWRALATESSTAQRAESVSTSPVAGEQKEAT